MLAFGILRLASLLMNCSCIAPLTPVVIVMRGFIFHPLFCMLLINGSYLACLCMRVCSGDLPWQYVNSMNCTMCVGASSRGVGVWFGALIMLKISRVNLAWHWQFVCGHIHFMSQYGTICSWFMLLRLPAFVSVYNWVCLLACSV